MFYHNLIKEISVIKMHYKGFSIKKMIYVFIATILVSLIVLSTTLLKNIGNWLIINDELKKANVIVVISGDKGKRLRHGVDLFHNKYADYLLVSGCNCPDHLYSHTPEMRKQVLALGVPSENIIMDLGANSGTGDQAINVMKILKKKEFNSAILVTSDFHTRRAKMIFNRACQKDNIEILISYPKINAISFNEWWKNRFTRRIVVIELIKLIWYWLSFSGRST
jgi:uncharacterized SAM-binding protein YcdF (DUF218 family)